MVLDFEFPHKDRPNGPRNDALEKTGRDLDWALFSIDFPWLLRPNMLVFNNQNDVKRKSAEVSPIALQQISKLKCKDARPGTPVWILTSHGFLPASLQPSAFIMASHARETIEVFVVQLTEKAAKADFVMEPTRKSAISLNQGDSGSWVVDQNTGEVYGYTVASDIFQDVYVVPFYLAMNDMQDVTGAASCELPTDPNWAEPSLTPMISDSEYVSASHSPQTILHSPCHRLSPTEPAVYVESESLPPEISCHRISPTEPAVYDESASPPPLKVYRSFFQKASSRREPKRENHGHSWLRRQLRRCFFEEERHTRTVAMGAVSCDLPKDTDSIELEHNTPDSGYASVDC